MNALLRSPKGKIGAVAVGGLVVLLALWFLLVSPQRAKATEARVPTSPRPRRSSSSARPPSRSPSANVSVRPSDVYRLTKALPDDTNMSGILLDVNRIAAQNKLTFISITPAPQVRRNRIPAAAARRHACRAASATSRASSVTSARSCPSATSGSMPAVASTRCRASTSRRPIARPSSRSSRPR